MPRDYVRKTHAKCSGEDLKLAVRDVRRKNVAIQRASKMYGVPRSTLRRHVLSDVEQGRPFVLSAGLLNKVIIAAVLYAKTPREVREAAHSVALKSGILMPESWRKNKAAGNDWWLGLIKKNGLYRIFWQQILMPQNPVSQWLVEIAAGRIREIWVFRSATVVVK